MPLGRLYVDLIPRSMLVTKLDVCVVCVCVHIIYMFKENQRVRVSIL